MHKVAQLIWIIAIYSFFRIIFSVLPSSLKVLAWRARGWISSSCCLRNILKYQNIISNAYLLPCIPPGHGGWVRCGRNSGLERAALGRTTAVAARAPSTYANASWTVLSFKDYQKQAYQMVISTYKLHENNYLDDDHLFPWEKWKALVISGS